MFENMNRRKSLRTLAAASNRPSESLDVQLRWNTPLLAGAMAIATLAVLAYLPCLRGGFIWDDELLLTNNDLIRGTNGLARIWFSTEPVDYWPLTSTSFWIEWRLWGMNSAGYHVTNLLLHIASALLFWAVLRKLAIPGAFLAAVLFTMHPVNVESVAWIAQRKNMLAIFFFLLSILWYLKSALLDTRPRLSRDGWYWLSLGAFLLAMLSKGSVAVLPAILLLILWWRRGINWRDALRIAPLFTLAVILTSVNIWFQTHGSQEVIREASFVERLLGAGAIIWFYLLKALLPLDLAFIYPPWSVRAGNPLWWFPLIAALCVTGILWWQRKSTVGSALFLAWSCFCVALLPVMGFADVGFMKYSLVADHYEHIALLSVIALLAAGFSIWQARVSTVARISSWGVASVVIAILCLLTSQQAQLYGNPNSLYMATLEKNPDCWVIHNLLGREFHQSGDVGRAVDEYRRAVELRPDLVEARSNLGSGLLGMGHLSAAVEQFTAALKLAPNRPDIHTNLATALLAMGDKTAAKEHYSTALQQMPNFALAHAGLGHLLFLEKQYASAIEQFQQAVQLRPDYADAHLNLGLAFEQSGNLPAAIEQFQQVLQLKPDYAEAQNAWGSALFNGGRPEDAITHFEQAIQLAPDYFTAYSNLASCYRRMNQPEQALSVAENALHRAQVVGNSEWVAQIQSWLTQQRSASAKEKPSKTNASNSK